MLADVLDVPPGGVPVSVKVPAVGLPVSEIVCTSLTLQHALAIRSSETAIPRIFAPAGSPRLKLVVSWFAPVATAAMALVAYTLLFVYTFVGFVQPAPALGECALPVTVGPVIDDPLADVDVRARAGDRAAVDEAEVALRRERGRHRDGVDREAGGAVLVEAAPGPEVGAGNEGAHDRRLRERRLPRRVAGASRGGDRPGDLDGDAVRDDHAGCRQASAAVGVGAAERGVGARCRGEEVDWSSPVGSSTPFRRASASARPASASWYALAVDWSVYE